ncbi:MAG TPA: hypothetical protein VL588_00740 [Bdellovibrionota bacterium]|jgi:hypothetical protein|nr:hypothetical protein [Bdellovibrionota bacterium]
MRLTVLAMVIAAGLAPAGLRAADAPERPADRATYRLEWKLDSAGAVTKTYEVIYEGARLQAAQAEWSRSMGGGEALVRNFLPYLEAGDKLVKEEHAGHHFTFVYERPAGGGEKSGPDPGVGLWRPVFEDPVTLPFHSQSGSRIDTSSAPLETLVEITYLSPRDYSQLQGEEPVRIETRHVTAEAKGERIRHDGLFGAKITVRVTTLAGTLSDQEKKALGTDINTWVMAQLTGMHLFGHPGEPASQQSRFADVWSGRAMTFDLGGYSFRGTGVFGMSTSGALAYERRVLGDLMWRVGSVGMKGSFGFPSDEVGHGNISFAFDLFAASELKMRFSYLGSEKQDRHMRYFVELAGGAELHKFFAAGYGSDFAPGFAPGYTLALSWGAFNPQPAGAMGLSSLTASIALRYRRLISHSPYTNSVAVEFEVH